LKHRQCIAQGESLKKRDEGEQALAQLTWLPQVGCATGYTACRGLKCWLGIEVYLTLILKKRIKKAIKIEENRQHQRKNSN
jgi:hypothetical protein